MPARTNAFQRLVRAIQGHFSRSGTVTESRFLQDRDTGSPVEVDIVIEEKVGGHNVLVGIECTSGKRKATIEWYREMRAKHADLPIAKTVLVSEPGFTKEVHKKAAKDNVTLLTLGQAQSFKWESLFAKLRDGTVADVRFDLRKFSVKFKTSVNESDAKPFGATAIVKGPGIEAPIGGLIIAAAQQAKLTAKIMSNLRAVMEKTDHFDFSFRVPEGTHIDLDGKRLDVDEISATFGIRPRFLPVDWRPVDFNGQAVATGTFPAGFLFPGTAGDTVVTVSQKPDDSMKISLLDPSDTDVPLDVFPHALWKKDAGNDPAA